MPKEERAKEQKEEKPTEKPSTREVKEKAARAPAAKETEAAPEEVKEEIKKVPKGKVPKKKKVSKKIYAIYKVEGATATRLRPFCERCGPGYFMADHGNRYACGHCGFTRYKVAEPAQVS